MFDDAQDLCFSRRRVFVFFLPLVARSRGSLPVAQQNNKKQQETTRTPPESCFV
jgi:hypothetical protein